MIVPPYLIAAAQSSHKKFWPKGPFVSVNIAQQAPDASASTCGSLVGEATTRIVALATQLAQANAKIADLQKQIDAAKPKDPPKSDAPK